MTNGLNKLAADLKTTGICREDCVIKMGLPKGSLLRFVSNQESIPNRLTTTTVDETNQFLSATVHTNFGITFLLTEE